MLWSELSQHDQLWRIDATRAKNGLQHEVPLSPLAVEILRCLPRRDNRELVFGSSAGAFQGWSNAKTALDARIRNVMSEDRGPDEFRTPWRLHDIRRTVATGLADLGVLPHIVEAVLNHVSGHRAGVAGTYNRAVYATEKRDALNRWATFVNETRAATNGRGDVAQL